MNKFTSHCRDGLSFIASVQATSDFLSKVRKIKAYFNFTKTTSTAILQRAVKSRKIELVRQHQYLFWFMSTVRDCRVKRRILVERELHLKRQAEVERQKQETAGK
jgi:hypothetical protein